MRHLAALILVTILVGLPSCKFFKGKKLFGRKADTMAVWQARQDNIREIDSIRKAQERLLSIERARLDSISSSDAQRKLWESKYKYNIIVGSFITPQYAKDQAADFRLKGYETRIIQMPGSRFELVAAESHSSFSTAVKRLQQFQDTLVVDAWMYINK
jgi:hypothetical protein